MWHATKRHWQELRSQRPGQRFQAFYEEHAAHRSGWARYLTLAAAVVSFAIGVVLAFIPGPAVVFFALTAAMVSTQSHSVARKLDRIELYAHALWRKHQRRRRERQAKGLLLHPKNDATTVDRKEQRGRACRNCC